MYGLDAISAHNGWCMAGLGISIVFTGLVLLSIIVAQIHKILRIYDKKNTYIKLAKNLFRKKNKLESNSYELPASQKVSGAISQCRILVEKIGEPFSLPRLINLFEKYGISHPYSTINDLIGSGFIVPDGKGYFLWKQNSKKIM
ncbi:MAG: OadG family protein [Deltaproteobacteria bacterium]|nr:OadG family protein [Deltaproteobacteria bacterium]MBW2662086.1 OadG family protein [Deltaproteobacteria bacterium]